MQQIIAFAMAIMTSLSFKSSTVVASQTITPPPTPMVSNQPEITVTDLNITVKTRAPLVFDESAVLGIESEATLPIITPTPTPTPKPSVTPKTSKKPEKDMQTATQSATNPMTPQPSVTPTTIAHQQPTGPELNAWFTQYSNEYKIDREWLRKIAVCESGFNTNSKSKYYAGMYQFAESSWKAVRNRMGQDPNPDLRYNAQEAVKTAAYMLAHGQANAWPNCK